MTAPQPDSRTALEIQALKDMLARENRLIIEREEEICTLRAEVEALRADLAALRARRFPIMDGPSIPWAMIEPHEAQAKKNHGGQGVQRLAERGGLSCCEAVAVLLDRPWHTMEHASAREELIELTERWEARRALGTSGRGACEHTFEANPGMYDTSHRYCTKCGRAE